MCSHREPVQKEKRFRPRLSPEAGYSLEAGRGGRSSKSINRRTKRVMSSKSGEESVSDRGSDQPTK